MTDVYKCKVCGYESNMPGVHCGQPMEKQETTAAETPATEPDSMVSSTENTESENKPSEQVPPQ